jgi:hypothetical protein
MWTDQLFVVIASVIGAVGVIVLFGCGLVFLSRAQNANGKRVLRNGALSMACFTSCAALLAIGLYLYSKDPIN